MRVSGPNLVAGAFVSSFFDEGGRMRIGSSKQCVLGACLLVVVFVTALSGVVTIQTDRNAAVVFVHATVIDGTGAAARPNQTVVLSGSRITAVGSSSSVPIPQGARTIDATGRFLIPGLWDAHVHTRFEGIDHMRLLVANGITSARNMSAPWEYLPEILALRDQIEKVDRVGPRLLTAGPVLDGPGANRTSNAVINIADEGQQAVRRVKRDGADFVKVYNLLSRESFFAIAAEAKAQGLPFAGHLPFAIRAEEASDAGQLSIEHADAIVRASSLREEEIRRQLQQRFPASGASVDVAKLKTLADRLKKNRTKRGADTFKLLEGTQRIFRRCQRRSAPLCTRCVLGGMEARPATTAFPRG
jgi:hypothetical protein